MRTDRNRALRGLSWGLVLGLAAFASPLAAQGSAVAVIVHSSNQEGQLTRREIRDYLALEKTRWPNEEDVFVYTPKAGEAKNVMLRVVYELSASQLRDLLDQKSSSNEGSANEKSTDAEIKAKVKKWPGAIGYVSADSVDADDTVAALIVDGKKIDSPQYPLKIKP